VCQSLVHIFFIWVLGLRLLVKHSLSLVGLFACFLFACGKNLVLLTLHTLGAAAFSSV